MNGTIPSPVDGSAYNSINGFRYFIGLAIGVIFLISSIAIASYCCSRDSSQSQPQQRSSQSESRDDNSISIEVGLDDATLDSYPKLLYSQAKFQNRSTGITTITSCCSICLADYDSADMLRLLPDCGHLFHLKCVDPWLRQHPTCPICRSATSPTSLSYHLPEVLTLNNHIIRT